SGRSGLRMLRDRRIPGHWPGRPRRARAPRRKTPRRRATHRRRPGACLVPPRRPSLDTIECPRVRRNPRRAPRRGRERHHRPARGEERPHLPDLRGARARRARAEVADLVRRAVENGSGRTRHPDDFTSDVTVERTQPPPAHFCRESGVRDGFAADWMTPLHLLIRNQFRSHWSGRYVRMSKYGREGLTHVSRRPGESKPWVRRAAPRWTAPGTGGGADANV